MRIYTRLEEILNVAGFVALTCGLFGFIPCYWLFKSMNGALIIAAIVAFLSFILTFYLMDRSTPHFRIATVYDDPAPGSSIIDEDGNEVIAAQTPEEEGPSNEAGVEVDERFMEVVGLIEKDFNPTIIRDDTEMESRLFTLLAKQYPDRIQRDVQAVDGKIDLVFDNEYGIEARVIRSEEPLRVLMGDVAFYTDRYTNIAVVIYVDRLLATKLDLERYTEKLDNCGALVIIKQGMIESSRTY